MKMRKSIYVSTHRRTPNMEMEMDDERTFFVLVYFYFWGEEKEVRGFK